MKYDMEALNDHVAQCRRTTAAIGQPASLTAAFPTPAQTAEDAGYPPSLVDALESDGRTCFFACELRGGKHLLFDRADLVGDGSLWIRLHGVPVEDVDIYPDLTEEAVTVDVRIDEIIWVTAVPDVVARGARH